MAGSHPFRDSASFGKRIEYWVIGRMLKEGMDVYVVEIKPLDHSTTTFDIDNDGDKERTAWVGTDDGMLVIDLNGDNQFTQSKEMAFGEWTTEQDTDLHALVKVFDSNWDGTFVSRDARFNEFRIWKDTNSTGVADAGEMVTLQAAGIATNDALYWRWANV